MQWLLSAVRKLFRMYIFHVSRKELQAEVSSVLPVICDDSLLLELYFFAPLE
jgi:hypothetical protein